MIRKDIYSVKTFDSFHRLWCHEFMATDSRKAMRKINEVRNDHTLGIIRQAKLVHPSQWVVDGYCAAGNRIES
jgi:hypothetical protein